jgi:hypothetical protein
MKTGIRFALIASLGLMANVASAIPLQVNVSTFGLGSIGEWSLSQSGATEGDGSWFHSFLGNVDDSWNLEIDPGLYDWSISGGGLGSEVRWNVLLDGMEVVSGSQSNYRGLFFINEDYTVSAAPVSVPEPETLTLLSVGLGLLAFGLRSKRRRQIA